MRTSNRLLGVSAFIACMAVCSTAVAGSGRSVPVMTAFTVKLDQPVSAKTVTNGSPFTATLKEPVEVDGQTIIPTGASAGGVLTRESGNSTQIELNSVFVNGRSYRITTEPVAMGQKTSLAAGATLTFHLMLSFTVVK